MSRPAACGLLLAVLVACRPEPVPPDPPDAAPVVHSGPAGLGHRSAPRSMDTVRIDSAGCPGLAPASPGPPSTLPPGLYDEANWVTDPPYHAPYARGLVQIRFRTGTQPEEVRNALLRVCGDVVGGAGGSHYVRIRGNPRGERLQEAIQVLRALPQVGSAEPAYIWTDMPAGRDSPADPPR